MWTITNRQRGIIETMSKVLNNVVFWWSDREEVYRGWSKSGYMHETSEKWVRRQVVFFREDVLLLSTKSNTRYTKCNVHFVIQLLFIFPLLFHKHARNLVIPSHCTFAFSTFFNCATFRRYNPFSIFVRFIGHAPFRKMTYNIENNEISKLGKQNNS